LLLKIACVFTFDKLQFVRCQYAGRDGESAKAKEWGHKDDGRSLDEIKHLSWSCETRAWQ
jgi:hypothetical protein